MKTHILFVDDEKNVLKSLQRSFLDEERYELLMAESGEKAIGLLREWTPAVIVADMRMPGMDGVAFLKKAQQLCPESVCMVLSGYADIDSIMQAINEGHVWRYITKPWDDNDLKLSVRNAVEYYEKRVQTKRLLDEVERKNIQLREVNTQLEDRVRERTLQLQKRSELLQMIVDNVAVEKIMVHATEAVSTMLDGRRVFIYADCLSETFGAGDIGTTLDTIATRTVQEGNDIYEEHGVGLVLSRANLVLGALVIENDQELSPLRVTEAVDAFGSIIAIALSQQKAIQDIPGFLESLGEIE